MLPRQENVFRLEVFLDMAKLDLIKKIEICQKKIFFTFYIKKYLSNFNAGHIKFCGLWENKLTLRQHLFL